MKKSSNLQFSICDFQFAIFLLILFTTSSVFAHGMDVFASVDGKTIHGKANFHDGTPARNADVKAFDFSGGEIDRTKTDEEGKFILEARFRCDYRLLVDTNDGHGGEFTILAASLPADLPQRSQADANHTESSRLEAAHDHKTTDEVDHDEAHFKALHAEIVRLQEQLNEYEHRLRFRDILGGIGFIVGIVGVACGYYYRGLCNKEKGERGKMGKA